MSASSKNGASSAPPRFSIPRTPNRLPASPPEASELTFTARTSLDLNARDSVAKLVRSEPGLVVMADCPLNCRGTAKQPVPSP